MNGYVSPAEELFPVHCSTIEELAESGAAKVARERAALVRADGSAMFTPAEHAEREAAILEAAGAAYDRSARQFLSLADAEQAKVAVELAKLDGDPFDRLTANEQAKAATRRAFVQEDVASLPADELARLARAAIAANDRAGCYLLLRYLARRPRDAARDAGLAEAVRDLGDIFGTSDRSEKRRSLERRIEATKSLRGRVDMGRRRVDGRHERMEAGMRQTIGSMF